MTPEIIYIVCVLFILLTQSIITFVNFFHNMVFSCILLTSHNQAVILEQLTHFNIALLACFVMLTWPIITIVILDHSDAIWVSDNHSNIRSINALDYNIIYVLHYRAKIINYNFWQIFHNGIILCILFASHKAGSDIRPFKSLM